MDKAVSPFKEKDSIYDNKLNKFLFDKSKENFDLLTEEEHKILGERLKNAVLGKKQEQTRVLGPDSEQYRFVEKIFRRYSEILHSYETMQMIGVFVRQYPNYQSYKSHGITKTKYIKYHIENYLNEVYIFRLRTRILLKVLEKCLNEKKMSDQVNNLKKLYKIIDSTLKNLTEIRGQHVHNRRYTDDKIDQLESLELLTHDGALGRLDLIKNLNYRFIRSDWHKTITENNEQLKELTRLICNEISDVVINQLYPKYKS